MIRKKSVRKAGRKQFSAEFKQQALLRAVKDRMPSVTRDWAWSRHNCMRGEREPSSGARMPKCSVCSRQRRPD